MSGRVHLLASTNGREVTTGCGITARTGNLLTTMWTSDATCEPCLRRACPECKAGVKHVH
jgi:hypothetical protein